MGASAQFVNYSKVKTFKYVDKFRVPTVLSCYIYYLNPAAKYFSILSFITASFPPPPHPPTRKARAHKTKNLI